MRRLLDSRRRWWVPGWLDRALPHREPDGPRSVGLEREDDLVTR